MNVLVALLVGLVIWICAWTFGIKAFDAFLVTVALVVGAVTYNLFIAPIREQYRA
jgi:hypothetical protein